VFSVLLRRLTISGFRRGLGGSRGWLLLGIAATSVRLLRYLARGDEEVVYRSVIRDGDVLEVLARRPNRK
jgi:hypothetical protein